MPDFKDLRELLEARFQAEMADPGDRPAAMAHFNHLVDDICRETRITRLRLLEAIAIPYRAHRNGRLKQETREGRG